jgi:DNA-binding LacI/PurR family transcriptional regulator
VRKDTEVKRPTIGDVAERAGVTRAAVSFALNGQPGVSAATRERIVAIAAEMGFQPSSAARALSNGHAGAFGLVIGRPATTFGFEPFYMQFVSGIEAELSPGHIALLLTLAEDQATEIAAYKTWWAQRRVDGVLLVDLERHDPRIAVLEQLRLPAVAVGDPAASGSFPAVWGDDAATTHTLVRYLASLGHRRIARVSGISRYLYTQIRTAAFSEATGAAGVETVVAEADFTSEHGAEATRALLQSARPPTAIVYDNDLMAVAGLGQAQQMGVDVPADLSILAWDDSVLCELVHPPLTAMHRDIAGLGGQAARSLRSLAAGQEVGHFQAPPPVLLPRGSTAPPPRRQQRQPRHGS